MPLGGTMSIDNQLKAGLAELDCSAAVFIAISGKSSTSKLSQAFSGIRALDAEESLALKQTLDEMRKLQVDIAAYIGHKVPIAWCASLREVLEDRRTQKSILKSPFTLPGPAVVTPQVNPTLIDLAVAALHPEK
jgi:hypothetical protein